jgi:hypothetical protein
MARRVVFEGMRNALDPRVVVDSSSASVMGCVGADERAAAQQQLSAQG